MKFRASTSNPPIGGLITLKAANVSGVELEWGKETSLEVNPEVQFKTSNSISRYLARRYGQSALYGSNIIQQCEIDHWLSFSIGELDHTKNFKSCLDYLDKCLANVTFLVGNKYSIADFVVWGSLFNSTEWVQLMTNREVPSNVTRWYSLIKSLDFVSDIISSLPEKLRSKDTLEGMRKEEGKFVDLPGAEMGKVVVRFPPEASGYLHIGHAKAALLNQYYKEAFNGKLIMRFDDTNPAKEKVDFEKVILGDLDLLEIKPDEFTHTSNYFDLMLDYCQRMIEEQKAYVDDTDPETMKKEREQKLASKNRENSVEKNLQMWNEMKNGTELGQKCCVRAKIDMNSPNGCMRDPTIYRCKNEPHPRTGTKYKVYPTYDFACPIVDSIEGVTHCLRTMEYHDRDDQFYWFIDALGLRKPYIWEYARLNMTNTVLSKRKLTWFVENKQVDGWDDPRFPTVRGVVRRGMTVEGLKQFVIAQGSSRSVVVMEWDKIWAFNKKVIDPVAPRFSAVSTNSNVVVHVSNVNEEAVKVPKHPKNPDIGEKTVWLGPKLIIDEQDAEDFKENSNVTFINWGNLRIKKVVRKDNKITEVLAEPNLDDKDYKKTMKITWLAETKQAPLVPCICVYFEHIINKAVLGKEEDFKQYIGHCTKVEVPMLGDPELATLKKSEIIQIQRKGFFICDSPYEPVSLHTGRPSPLILFSVPDGHTKQMPTCGPPKTQQKENEQVVKAPPQADGDVSAIVDKIKSQGDLVRDLKQKKAEKSVVDVEVKKLLALKSEFKKVYGQDWKPDLIIDSKKSVEAPPQGDGDASAIFDKIKSQGDVVRDLKQQKAEKSVVDVEVKKLLALKTEFKKVYGQDWKPDLIIDSKKSVEAPPQGDGDVSAIFDKIKSQGDLVRDLKQKKAEKSVVDVEVKKLLALKTEFKKVYGQDWKPDLIIDSKKSVEAPPQGDGDASAIFDKIKSQGDVVRDVKQKKAEKSVVDVEVKKLLALKSEFKKVYGQDWKPDLIIDSKKSVEALPQGDGDASAIFDKIKSQGDLVRDLKQKKAEKSVVDVEVKKLLALKSEFKKVYGQDWKPDLIIDSKKSDAADSVKPVNPQKPASNIKDLLDKITEVGNKIRKLKSDKVDKNVVAEEVKALLELKSSFKVATGQDWKPDVDISKLENISVLEKSSIKSDDKSETEKKVSQLTTKINEQGNIVRDLKSSGASKEEINSQVQLLLNLKNEYKSVSGKDFPTERKAPSKEKGKEKSPEAKTPSKEKSKEKLSKPVKPKKEEKTSNQNNETVGQTKKVTRLCLEARKEENLPDWYSQVIVKGEMIEYFDVSGCYILRPWSFEIWEKIREWLDHEIKKLGVKNCYFPIFVSKSVLEKEKTHIADFAPEVAWVTKSGDSDLAEPIAIRPTSETVMYPSYAKWVQSYRDLPIRLNQWNNVVRWEFKHPQPFLRTREFLWQEGHTAFAGMNEALEEVNVILDLYAKIYTDLLAIPVVKGRKTEKEKFAGGDFTLTVEAYISASGRAIQGATSHHLGQNFSKMFEIVFDDPVTQERCYVYQNSWGITTRTIGVLIMVHGDNQGLVLPPKVASIQVVIVPCGLTVNLKDSEKEEIINACKETENVLVNSGIKVYGDYRDNYSPGWKFNHWELKGVPVRVEIGPKDMKLNQVQTVRRDSGLKETVSKNSLVDSIHKLLDTIQADMLKKASKELQEHMVVCKQWKDFCQHLDQKNIILAPFCGEINCEDTIKQNSAREDQEDSGAPSMGAKGLCIPFDQPNGGIKDEDRCINPECKLRPKFYTLFGRSY